MPDHRSSPTHPASTLDVAERAEALVRSACSSDLRAARVLMAADPALVMIWRARA